MEIKFFKKIYSKKGVDNAINAYSNLAQIKFVEDDSFYFITMENIDDEVRDIIKDEFCNYVLFETAKCP
ncbi:MAG: HxsD-like protein [Clostridia bacterium]|nr:HxsD-like protein [Clostridia bacterium]